MASIKIDFLVQSSPYKLYVWDFSSWGLIEGKPSIVEITLPGYEQPITKFFDKNKLNTYNSNLLDSGCETEDCLTTLTDGIYKIKVIGSPDKFSSESYYL